MTTTAPNTGFQPVQLKRAALWMGVVVVVLWAIELVNQITGGTLEMLGVSPREITELPQIYTAPLIHHGWSHLIGNTVPLFVLGVLVAISGVLRLAIVTAISATVSGLLVWLVAMPNTVTLGASGVIFGLLTYLLARAIFSRRLAQFAIAVVVFVVYGTLLWGVLPADPRVSWLGHLGGAIGGVAAAWFLHSTSERRKRLAPEMPA